MEAIDNFNYILQSFKIKAKCVDYKSKNNYFFYDLELSPSVRIKDINKIGDEISLALKTPCKPSIKLIREQGVVRLEFVKSNSNQLKLFECFSEANNKPQGGLVCLLGQQVDGQNIWMDLCQNPHMIIAGTTGSGKSTLLHNIIANVLYYNNARLFLVDPKNVEFNKYQKQFNNVYTYYDYDSALKLIHNIIQIMNHRYEAISLGMAAQFRPQLIIIDEFADLIMQDKENALYNALCQLAQKCRAANIHIILSTQRPSAHIISGQIKANFPARISCKVASHIDSKIILDSTGAENLLGKGDALLKDSSRSLERFQVAYTSPTEIINYFNKN
jgi:S-DNA-T family DNA segregation ATPase FtsK/SpoIIIE